MGCTTGNVQDFQKQTNTIITNSQNFNNNANQTPRITVSHSNQMSSLASPTLKERQSKRIYQGEEYQYTLKSFHPIEKLAENTVYKQFRVINNHTNSVQMMYVIPLTFEIKHQKLSALMQLKEKNLLNINFVFLDDNFRYIITDFSLVNIYDAVFHYKTMTIDKLKRILRSILTGINYIYEQNENIFRLDYTKIKILNESFAVKLEYFDIKYLIYCGEEINPIENVLYEVGKVLLVLLNSKSEIAFKVYKDFDISDYYSGEDLLQEVPIELIEVMEVLLSGQERNISKILSLPYFIDHVNVQSVHNINNNKAFYSFYSKYFLYKSTQKFLKNHSLSKGNTSIYASLFDNIENNQLGNQINSTTLASNLKNKMENRYIQFEMTEIVSLLDNVQLSIFSQEQIVKMLAEYDCSLYKNQVKKAFDLFDSNNSGKVQVELLKEIFDVYMKTDDEVDGIIEEVDKSDDHMLTFNEFLYILIKIN